MFKKSSLLLLALIYVQFLFGQNTIQGKIMDTVDSKIVENATVILLDAKDSTIIKFSRSKKDGSFNLSELPTGEYIILVTHQSFADYVSPVSLDAAMKNLGVVPITPMSKLLEEVVVSGVSAIRVKGDTTIYTADSFVVGANANVEELLTKLPGIQVDANGNIKAMGQDVRKVLVDGEEFFGDDPGMAVKNLRADAVKEVQVFDKKSEQAEFTGIDDGQTAKTINLKLKEDKRKGYFGKVELAGGLQDDISNRFNNNLMLSSFKGKRKISGFLLNGNVGKAGLNWEDRERYGMNDESGFQTDGDGVVIYYGGGDDELMLNTMNGFTTNINAGLQYTNKWNNKHDFNFSPKYNSQDYINNSSSFSQSFIGDSILTNNSNTFTNADRYNLRQSLIYKWQLDSNKTLTLRTNATYSHSESEENTNSISTGGNDVLKNKSNRYKQYENDKFSHNSSLSYQQKFKKNRRTLTVNMKLNSYKMDLRNKLQADNFSYFDGIEVSNVSQDQYTSGDNVNSIFSGNFVYTEPISKTFSLLVGYQIAVNSSRNDQSTYRYSNITGKYDELLDSLTNDFKQVLTEHRPSLKISYNSKKLNYNFGGSVALVDFDLRNYSLNNNIRRNYENFFPEASLNYKYKSNSSLRFNYNGSTIQPTVNQLQPLNNNSNYFLQTIGNPDLKPTFRHSLSVNHQSYNFLKEKWTYQSINFSVSDNAITYNRRVDLDSNKTIMRPENIDGNFSINAYMGMGSKLKKLKINYDINPNINYYENNQFINDEKVKAKQLSAGLNVGVRKDKAKKYETYIGSNVGYNRRTLSSDNNKIYFFSNTLTARAKVYYKKVWSLTSQYNYTWRQKTEQFNESINIHLWEARLEKSFFKEEFTAFVSINDILNQNIDVQRQFSNNSLSEVRNDRLMQYWLVGFIWNFKNKN